MLVSIVIYVYTPQVQFRAVFDRVKNLAHRVSCFWNPSLHEPLLVMTQVSSLHSVHTVKLLVSNRRGVN